MILVAGTSTLFRQNAADEAEPQVLCTQEVQMCPDGSGVGRVPPDCLFAACPTPSVPDEAATDAIFTGTIKAYSTGCFVDGICSVTVDDKVVITTIGWRANVPVGSLQGVASIGDLEQKIGAKATVYALRNSDKEYTLYGNSAYYIKVQ